MNNRFIHFLLLIILLVAGLVIYRNKNQQKVHYHAGFKVFVDNKLEDFSGLKYMKLTKCDSEEGGHDVDEQLEKAHLHDRVGNVAHVHRQGAKWKDLFINLRYEFDKQKNLTGYINGKKVDNILDQTINPFDSVIIISGSVNNLENKIKNRVPQKRIEEIDKKSESC